MKSMYASFMFKLKNITRKDVLQFLENNAITILLLLIALYTGLTQENFFTVRVMKNISVNTSIRFFVALGVSGCLITKGTDLSAGRQVAFAGCLASIFLQNPDYAGKFLPWLQEYPLLIVFACVILATMIIGFFNGLIVSYMHVPPFIATLGMQTLVYGCVLIFTKSQPIGSLRMDYMDIATREILGIPFLLIIAIIVGFIMWFIYNKTRHGKYMFAIGGNENAAEVSGINISFTKIRIYVTASLLYALCGILLAAKTGGASVGLAGGWELEAIAACTIGGVSTNGGVGKISGILLGVLVFELLKTSLQFLRVPTDYTYIVQGLVIIIAVALDIRKYIAKK